MMQQKKFTGKVYLKKGQTIHVKIKRLGINGEGIGYYKKKIIFIPGALPKEFVKAKITESNRNYAKAKLLEIVEKSSQRVDPADHYDVGGIELEHLNYDAQLDFKRDVILQALEKFK
ncbi:TRAM domain-containing protein, partial [Ligilactobacillus ruminis]